MVKTLATTTAALTLLASTSAFAQQQPIVADLLGAGFEIKAAGLQLGNLMVVFLQKGEEAFICVGSGDEINRPGALECLAMHRVPKG